MKVAIAIILISFVVMNLMFMFAFLRICLKGGLTYFSGKSNVYMDKELYNETYPGGKDANI